LKQNKKSEATEKIISRLRNEFNEDMKEVNVEIKNQEKLLEQLSQQKTNVIHAYVTFNKVLSKNLVLDKYNKLSLYSYWFRTEHLKFKNKLITVDDAPEPSTILWENLGYSSVNIFFRRSIAVLLSVFLILCSLAIILGQKVVAGRSFSNGYNNDVNAVCPSNFYDYTKGEQRDYVRKNPASKHCYCDQFSLIKQENDSFCKSYFQKNVNAQVLTFFSSFVILLVNMAIESLLRFFFFIFYLIRRIYAEIEIEIDFII
jgi:hypothetical protein